MQFLLSSEMFELWVWPWSWSNEYESTAYEIKFVYGIIVIFGIKHEFMMLIDHFKPIQGVMDLYMNRAWSRVYECKWIWLVFKSNIIISTKLGGLWMLNMSLAWDGTLCKCCQNGWIIKI